MLPAPSTMVVLSLSTTTCGRDELVDRRVLELQAISSLMTSPP